MPESPLPLRPFRALLAVLLLACLPGCFTAALWEDFGDDDEWVVEYVLVSESRDELEGSLELRGPALAGGLVLCDADGDVAWRLVPGDDAEVAALVLENPEVCDVQLAVLEGRRNYVDDELVADEVRLELRAWWREGMLGELVEPDELSDDVRALLETPRASGYAFAATPRVNLPTPFRDCVRNAKACDHGWIAGLDGAWRVASGVFVDADGVVGFDPRGPSRPYPTERQLQQLALLERLDELGKYALVVRVTRADASRYVRLRPDWLWMASQGDRSSGRIVHTSSWSLVKASGGTVAVADASTALPSVRGRIGITNSYFERRELRREGGGGGFWWRAAFTPPALLADLAVGMLLAACGLDDVFCDDDDDESKAWKRRYGADPRDPQMVRDRERRARH